MWNFIASWVTYLLSAGFENFMFIASWIADKIMNGKKTFEGQLKLTKITQVAKEKDILQIKAIWFLFSTLLYSREIGSSIDFSPKIDALHLPYTISNNKYESQPKNRSTPSSIYNIKGIPPHNFCFWFHTLLQHKFWQWRRIHQIMQSHKHSCQYKYGD